MKRFTDTEKWSNPWYRKLPPKFKLFWNFICESCDVAGFWEIDFEYASFMCGDIINPDEALEYLNQGKIRVLPIENYWWIIDFMPFQFSNLKEDSKSPYIISIQKIVNKRILLFQEINEFKKIIQSKISNLKKISLIIQELRQNPTLSQELAKGYVRVSQPLAKGYPTLDQGLAKGSPRVSQGLAKGSETLDKPLAKTIETILENVEISDESNLKENLKDEEGKSIKSEESESDSKGSPRVSQGLAKGCPTLSQPLAKGSLTLSQGFKNKNKNKNNTNNNKNKNNNNIIINNNKNNKLEFENYFSIFSFPELKEFAEKQLQWKVMDWNEIVLSAFELQADHQEYIELAFMNLLVLGAIPKFRPHNPIQKLANLLQHPECLIRFQSKEDFYSYIQRNSDTSIEIPDGYLEQFEKEAKSALSPEESLKMIEKLKEKLKQEGVSNEKNCA